MKKTALLLVDFQNDYFESFQDARFPLSDTETASLNAFKILEFFRQNSLQIIHIRHESLVKGRFFEKDTKGSLIHENVKPLKDEIVITKNFPNSFKNTNLKEILEKLKIESLLIVGAMSHMCIDATTRAAKDFDYECSVVSDCITTRDLEFEGLKIEAKYVHASFMAALQNTYAKIVNTQDVLEGFKNT